MAHRIILLLVVLSLAITPVFAQSAEPPPDPDSPNFAALTGCLPQPAFCDTFDQPKNGGTRSGDLDPTIWGVSRTTGDVAIGQRDNAWQPTLLEGCGGTTTVTPPRDILICNGQLREALNDGHTVAVLAMYPKQPFDFAGRTGRVAFDVTNDTLGTHDAWPEFWLTDKPSPAPFSHFDTWLSLPQDGFGVRFAANAVPGQFGSCPNNRALDQPRWTVDSAVVVRNYVLDDTEGYGSRTALQVKPLDCVISSDGPGDAPNHVELAISQDQIDVYATDPGSTELRHIAVISDANLSLTRGLIWLEDAHYNAAKAIEPCECGPHTQHTFTWDNVGFDGPFTYHDLSYDALDETTRNADGTQNLGKVSQPNQTARWDVLGVDKDPQAASVRVLFNLFPYTVPNTLTVTVNGHPHPVAWPYPDRLGFSWRTLAVTIPQSDLVDGTNAVLLGADQTLLTSNVNLVLVNVGGAPAPVPTPAATAAATSVPTTVPSTPVPTVAPATVVPTPIATPTAGPSGSCQVLVLLDGRLSPVTRDPSFCTNQ